MAEESGSIEYPAAWSAAVHWLLLQFQAGTEKVAELDLCMFMFQMDADATPFELLKELEEHGAIGPKHSGNVWKALPGKHRLDAAQMIHLEGLREILPVKLRAIAKEFCSTGRKPDAEKQTIPVAEQLPFGLHRCDIPQTLKREGYKPVLIQNDAYWKLMEALMAAAPNAVAESKLQHLFPHKSDRDNAPKKLRNIIDSLGLTVKSWVLMELEN